QPAAEEIRPHRWEGLPAAATKAQNPPARVLPSPPVPTARVGAQRTARVGRVTAPASASRHGSALRHPSALRSTLRERGETSPPAPLLCKERGGWSRRRATLCLCCRELIRPLHGSRSPRKSLT